MVDSFNVLTERGRTGIGTLAKEYLSSGVTPGRPEETALEVRGLNGGIETSEIIKGHTNPQGKEDVVSVRQTPLTASLAGVVGNGYNDAETLYKFRNAINW